MSKKPRKIDWKRFSETAMGSELSPQHFITTTSLEHGRQLLETYVGEDALLDAADLCLAAYDAIIPSAAHVESMLRVLQSAKVAQYLGTLFQSSNNANDQWKAARLLREVGGSAGLVYLEALARSSSVEVRREALRYCADWVDYVEVLPGGIERILAVVEHDSDEEIRALVERIHARAARE